MTTRIRHPENKNIGQQYPHRAYIVDQQQVEDIARELGVSVDFSHPDIRSLKMYEDEERQVSLSPEEENRTEGYGLSPQESLCPRRKQQPVLETQELAGHSLEACNDRGEYVIPHIILMLAGVTTLSVFLDSWSLVSFKTFFLVYGALSLFCTLILLILSRDLVEEPGIIPRV